MALISYQCVFCWCDRGEDSQEVFWTRFKESKHFAAFKFSLFNFEYVILTYISSSVHVRGVEADHQLSAKASTI